MITISMQFFGGRGSSSGRGGGAGGGKIPAAKIQELEQAHQTILTNLENTINSRMGTDAGAWDGGYESGARAILQDLAGAKYNVSRYKLQKESTFDPVSVSEVESNLDKSLQGYQNRPHDSWMDGYYSGAVLMLEKATGNKYSVSGYKLTRINPTPPKTTKAKSKPITNAQVVAWSTATLKRKLKTATGADKQKIKAELQSRGITSNTN